MNNPYQTPVDLTGDQPAPGESAPVDPSYVPRSLGHTAAVWVFVCCVSAAPSFLLGLGITANEYVAMVVGIAFFAVGYTVLDFGTSCQEWRADKLIRRTLRFSYGTRLAISIIFPIGLGLDMMCGAASMSLLQTVVGEQFMVMRDPGDGLGFAFTLLLTLIQGCVLNVVLAIYGLLIFCLSWIFARLKR